MSIPEEIGRNIVFLRETNGISRDRLAAEAMITRSYLYMVECGKGNPTVEILAKIANALDVPFEMLFVEDLPKQYGAIVTTHQYSGDPVNLHELAFLFKALDLFRQGKLKLEE